MKIALIKPVIGAPDKNLPLLEAAQDGDVQLKEYSIESGPMSIETECDSLAAGLGIVECAIAAQDDGAAAIVINCMADPALYAVRESVEIPVVGAAEAAIQWAYALGGRIGWVDVAENARWILQRQFDIYGATSRYVAFTTIKIPPTELEKSRERVFGRLCDKAAAMSTSSGVNTIILGCTLLTDMRHGLEAWLSKNPQCRSDRYHVIVGLPLAISTAIVLARQGLRHF
jgi:allantoin racemase